MKVSWEEMVAGKLGAARKSGDTTDVATFVKKALDEKRMKEWKAMTKKEQNSFEDSYHAFGAPASYHLDEARAKLLAAVLKKAEGE